MCFKNLSEISPNFSLYWIHKSAVQTEEVIRGNYAFHSLANWQKKRLITIIFFSNFKGCGEGSQNNSNIWIADTKWKETIAADFCELLPNGKIYFLSEERIFQISAAGILSSTSSDAVLPVLDHILSTCGN